MPRDNPEDMFSAEENLARNQGWAKPPPYETQLSREEEIAYREWAMHMGLSPEDAMGGPQTAYDMRGFYRAMRMGDPRAQTSINMHDMKRHFPDVWKTPYDATFSNQSLYALPHAPQWQGDRYMLPGGHVIFDDNAGRWYGTPQ